MRESSLVTLETPELRLLPTRSEMIRAYQAHDSSYDGIFFTAVRTTGVFCRPSCRPPRLPKPENVEFFGSIRQAVFAGYRPCKLCRPQTIEGAPPDWASTLIQRVVKDPSSRLKAADLKPFGVTPERARRWFQENYGMTFSAWMRARRLANAFQEIREGTDLDDVALGRGFESHSGFREAFSKTFGTPPGRAAHSECVFITLLESPIGQLLAGANPEGVCLLEFADRRMLDRNWQAIRNRFQCPIVPGNHPHLDRLREELGRYFLGELKEFTVPLVSQGTPFQQRVWTELRRIPSGQTISYQELAARIGQPTAMRAVARANGDNCLTIVIPCHRVIGKDGTLTGYGGGLWRKRLLLSLEQNGRLP